MKKLGPIIIGFIIGAVLTYYFCLRHGDMDMTTMDIEVKAPKDTISVAQAKILSKNWEQRNPTEVDSTLEVEGSKKKIRSVWWSLDEINEYLDYAKTESHNLGYTMTGIRVYLGNYGNVKDPIKKNRNTMFIVPTGPRNTSKASALSISLSVKEDDIPAPPLNEGNGGPNGYPQ